MATKQDTTSTTDPTPAEIAAQSLLPTPEQLAYNAQVDALSSGKYGGRVVTEVSVQRETNGVHVVAHYADDGQQPPAETFLFDYSVNTAPR